MKLLFCRSCADVRKLNSVGVVTCTCGKSQGRYLADGLHSVFRGEYAHVIGLDNHSLADALRAGHTFPEKGYDLISFLFPSGHPRALKVDANDRRLQSAAGS